MSGARNPAFGAAGILIAGLWLPWASITFLGVQAVTADGQEIGSDILDFPVGWLAAGCGVLGAAGAYWREGTLVLVGGIAALLITGYTVLAIPGKETNYTANGVPVGDAIQVEYAWGLFVLLGAAVALAVSGALLMREKEPTVTVDADEGLDESVGAP
jgi:hypothetical protein